MTIPTQSAVTLPAIADAGTITITANTRSATGNATTFAAVVSGQALIMPNDPTPIYAADTPVSAGGGIYTFTLMSAWGSVGYTGKAWALGEAPSDEELVILSQQNDIGNTAGRAAHDSAADGYCYLDATTATMWERNGPAGTWTNRCTTAVMWVSTTGSDTDDNNPVRATVNAAIAELAGAGDLSGWNVIIALKAGTYTTPIVLRDVTGTPLSLKICGEASLTGTHSASSYTISSASPLAAIQATNLESAWILEGFTLTASKGHLLQAKGARLRFNQLRFGSAPGAHIAALSAGSIVLAGDGYSIAGGANAHLLANGSGATVDLQAEATVAAPTVTISAASLFKTAFAWARASGHIFTGTGLIFVTKSNATGRRWRAEQNSSIDSGQSGEKYLPGTAGTAGNGIAVKNGEYI